MEPIIFATYVTDQRWMDYCAIPLQKSFLRFHPNIPFVIFQGDEVNNVFDGEPTRNIRFLKPSLGKRLSPGYEKVVLMDADQLVVGPLTELLEDNSGVAGIRSNDDNGVSLPCGAFRTPKIPWQIYLNCGLCAVSDHRVWEHWDKLNRTQSPHMNDAEQGLWNEVFYSGQYTTKLLDPVDSGVIYGTAANSHHWRKLYLENDKIMLNLAGKPKWVKILHRAGVGHIGPPENKFSADNFNPAVAEYIRKVSA